MNNIFWALLVLFLVAAFFRMNWVYYLVYVVGGVWIFSHWWIRRSLSRVTVERRLATHAFTNEVVRAELTLTNHTWLPLAWLQVQDAVPLELKDQADYRVALSLGARSSVTHAYTLFCKRRGYHTVGPLTLTTSDIFGFVNARWEELQPATLIIYPAIVPLVRLGLPSHAPLGALRSRQRLLEDPTRLHGVRAYATGDSLRRVHWKASAHEDTLLVKKFQPSKETPATIVLDLNRTAYVNRGFVGESEWAITVAASLASHLAGQRQAVGLVTNGWDALTQVTAAAIPQHTGQEHLMAVLSLLARVELQPVETSLAAWLPPHTAGLPWGTTLIVVTPALDAAAVWVLHGAYRRGIEVLVLVIARQAGFREVRAQAKQLGIAVKSTVYESDLRVLAEG